MWEALGTRRAPWTGGAWPQFHLSLDQAEGKGGSLSSSLGLALWADPRDFCEDSWPLAEDKFSFWSLDRCGMRPVSVSLAGTLCGVGVGHERKMALRSPGPMVCTSH